MPKFTSLNRRQWLKSVGATFAGLLMARRLPTIMLAEPPAPARQNDAAGSFANPGSAMSGQPETDRRYIHGFEAYPAS